MSDVPANTFLALFRGNPAVHYTRGDGAYKLVERGITLDDAERHLSGQEPSLLSIPILPDGNCHFACIDVDRHGEGDSPVDHVLLARRVTELGLPLLVSRSKTPTSAHLWLFLKEEAGFSAAAVRRVLQKYQGLLGIGGEVEIFPKQETLEEGKIGNGVNLPLFGSERVAFGKNGEPLDVAGFVALAQERKAYGTILAMRDLQPEASANGFGPSASKKQSKPMKASQVREVHEKHLESLRSARPGIRNETLNATSFFAARAFTAHALEGTEQEIKDAICKAAVASGMSDREIDATGKSGWRSGLEERPLLEVVQPPTLPWHNSSDQIVVPKSAAIIDKLIYQGSFTGLIAKPKMGKTTLALDAVEAIIYGKDFLKEPTTPGTVLYVSEQPLSSFAAELRNSGLLEDGQLKLNERKGQFHFVTIEDWYKLTWEGIVKATADFAKGIGASLVIFDTLSRIARVKEENSASEMQAAVDKLAPFLEAGIAALCVQHERKSGGDIQDAGRGTNALTGAVDVVLRLNRPTGSGSAPTYRQLEFVGRFPGPSAPRILNRATADSASRYELLGNMAAVKNVTAQQSILDLFEESETAMTEAEIIETIALSRSTAMRAIKKLVEDSLLEQTGEGNKTSPFQYARTKPPF
jgi:AAA domain-containing protein/TOTE conflict system primase-like protein/IclR-like helix-turn-helix domain-containing protein